MKMTDERAVNLIESFQTAVRAVAWAEAGGDDADPADVQAVDATREALKQALTAEHPVHETSSNDSISIAEGQLRRYWSAQGVSQERQNELIAQIAAKATPGAGVGPFTVRDHEHDR